MLGELTDEAIETLLAQHAAGRAPVHELHLRHRGGAMANAVKDRYDPTNLLQLNQNIRPSGRR